jgi:cysteine desulfurase
MVSPCFKTTKKSVSWLNLDANASFGFIPEIHSKVVDKLGVFCNPSAVHRGGQHSKQLLEEARNEVATLIGCQNDDEVVFTSGATEANNMAVSATCLNILNKRGIPQETMLLCGATDHPSIIASCVAWENVGFCHKMVAPAEIRSGKFCLQDESIAFASFIAGNNESGEIFDLKPFFESIKKVAPEVRTHADIVQLVGKTVVNWRDIGCDSVTISAHKIGGYPGVGALIGRRNTFPQALLHGGPQELRRRAGTENIPGIVSFGLAARFIRQNLDNQILKMDKVRRTLLKEMLSAIPDSCNNFSHITKVLPNTISLYIKSVRADDLIVALDMIGIGVSSGAACASGKPEGSHVLKAYELPKEQVFSSVRISVTGNETNEDISYIVSAFEKCVRRMRKVQE